MTTKSQTAPKPYTRRPKKTIVAKSAAQKPQRATPAVVDCAIDNINSDTKKPDEGFLASDNILKLDTSKKYTSVFSFEKEHVIAFLKHVYDNRSMYENDHHLIQNARVTADGLLTLYSIYNKNIEKHPSVPPSRTTFGKLLRQIMDTRVSSQSILCPAGMTPPSQSRKAYVFDYDKLRRYIETL